MKDIKHIRWDFHSVAWVMPGVQGGFGVGVKKLFSEIQPNSVCELIKYIAHATAEFFFIPSTWGPGEGPKGQISLNFNYLDNFKYF